MDSIEQKIDYFKLKWHGLLEADMPKDSTLRIAYTLAHDIEQLGHNTKVKPAMDRQVGITVYPIGKNLELTVNEDGMVEFYHWQYGIPASQMANIVAVLSTFRRKANG